jgi:hypothetical protein
MWYLTPPKGGADIYYIRSCTRATFRSDVRINVGMGGWTIDMLDFTFFMWCRVAFSHSVVLAILTIIFQKAQSHLSMVLFVVDRTDLPKEES